MRFMGRGVILSLIVAVPAAAWGAAQPSALAQVAGGLWEISGVPGSSEAIRECVPNVALLAQFEHRGRNCSRRVLSQSAAGTVIEYSCGSEGFGRSAMTLLTPRSIRIETQGISGGLPFNYVLQARRVGECASHKSAARH